MWRLRTRTLRRLALGCLGVSAAGTAQGADPRFAGPLELQDTFLPAQVRSQPYPESAVVLPAGRIETRIVTDWTNHLARTDSYLFDGESVTTTFRLRASPIEGLELGLDVPYTSRFEGHLDPFIELVERTADAQVEARFALPRGQYEALVLDEEGDPRLILDDDDGFGDLSLRVKGQLLGGEAPGFDLAWVAFLALPTGRDTYGGEGLSPGFGLHAQRPFGRVNLFGGGAIQYYGDAREQDLRLSPFRPMGYTGFEWKPTGWFGLLAEYQIYGALARTNRLLDDPAHYAAGAFRFYLFGGTLLELSVVENVFQNRNSSDVTFKAVLGQRF